MAERLVEAQQIHFEATKATISQYTFGWDIRLEEIMCDLASTVSDRAVLTNNLEELLASLGGGTNLKGQAETGPTDGAKMRSLGAENSAVDDPEIDKPVAESWNILKRDFLLRNVVTSCFVCPNLEQKSV